MDAAIKFAAGVRARSMASVTPSVVVVDDDISVRESLELLIADAGWRVELYASAKEFLRRPQPQPPRPSCLILDVNLPDLSGLELQKRIAGDSTGMPIIFITGYGDIPMTVKAIKAGAVEFLTKPLTAEVLLKAIESALERSRASFDQEAGLQSLRDRYLSLSQREKEVMGLVVLGRLNKQVGGVLGISEITVKAHRGRMMHKMGAHSVPEL